MPDSAEVRVGAVDADRTETGTSWPLPEWRGFFRVARCRRRWSQGPLACSAGATPTRRPSECGFVDIAGMRPLSLRSKTGGGDFPMSDSVPVPTPDTAAPVRPCPDGAALNIKGEHFPCTQMRHMAPECDTHEGWAHSNGEAEAIWQ